MWCNSRSKQFQVSGDIDQKRDRDRIVRDAERVRERRFGYRSGRHHFDRIADHGMPSHFAQDPSKDVHPFEEADSQLRRGGGRHVDDRQQKALALLPNCDVCKFTYIHIYTRVYIYVDFNPRENITISYNRNFLLLYIIISFYKSKKVFITIFNIILWLADKKFVWL